jgi:hypothetical protein
MTSDLTLRASPNPDPGDLVKLWKPLNKMTSDIDSTRAESRADAAQLKQRLSVLADSHAADTQALATSIAELGASLQDMHKTACQEWYARTPLYAYARCLRNPPLRCSQLVV